jgi:broad specificity phosphatase PhoE
LVKHSLPEVKPDVPAREWNLSSEGRILAHRLTASLQGYDPDVVFSSVEPKAFQTAQILGEELKKKVQVIDGLHEHDRSNAPFYSKDEFQSLVRQFFSNPDELIFGRETANQALERFCASMDALLKPQSDKNNIVVCHGTVISLYVSSVTGCDGYTLWRELGLPSYVVMDLNSKLMLEKQNIN